MSVYFRSTIAVFVIAVLCFFTFVAAAADPAPPNILIIYADDIGYGDLGCYGARAVQTPNVDRLAREGLRFTDAHAAAATCTPSRYSLLTGEYAWRRPGTGILPGDAALIIEPGRTTLASMLKRAGYATAAVGKWHLGLGAERGKLDWNGEIAPGPLQIGFDHCFIMPATGDRTPCVYVEDDRVVGLDPADPIAVGYDTPFAGEPNGVSHRAELRMNWRQGHNQAVINGIGRIGYMKGGKSARWKDEEMADDFARAAIRFVEQNRARPFFLYLATHGIHVPRVPHPRYVGRTAMGPRGDAIAEFDGTVGQILAALDRLQLAENTLMILSSDNGPVLDDGYEDDAVSRLGDHRPAGPLNGGKYSALEGGTRAVRRALAGAHKPGVSTALVGQIDLLATLAALTGQPLAQADGPDSFNLLPALLGESAKGREDLVEQGGPLALRAGAWKLIPAIQPGGKVAKGKGAAAADQLYDLAVDLGETNNLAPTQPERVADMKARLTEIADGGRSRP